jgi:CHAT domain-containing protein
MAAFYRSLSRQTVRDSGPSFAKALADARQALREWTLPWGSRPYAHPAYWAGVVLLGTAQVP